MRPAIVGLGLLVLVFTAASADLAVHLIWSRGVCERAIARVLDEREGILSNARFQVEAPSGPVGGFLQSLPRDVELVNCYDDASFIILGHDWDCTVEFADRSTAAVQSYWNYFGYTVRFRSFQSAGGHSADNGKPQVVSEGGVRGVIFPASRGSEAQLLTGGVEGYWTPELGDVRRFETGLRDFLASLDASPELVEITERLASYRRQYCGVILDGRRVLFVNFLSPVEAEPESSPPWTEQFIRVTDGGTGYWRLFWSVDESEYFGLVRNGLA